MPTIRASAVTLPAADELTRALLDAGTVKGPRATRRPFDGRASAGRDGARASGKKLLRLFWHTEGARMPEAVSLGVS
ncbi:MAG: hypothetical protein JWM93_1669 [Frankiales bacterium]|nr:hypothetical protein [Frankiales bacterium]